MTKRAPPVMFSPNTTGQPGMADWAGARGGRWRDQLAPMEAMLAPIDAPLIHALSLDAPYRIADIGCGGGGTTLQILRSAPTGSVVHGYDISVALVEAARARTPADERVLTFTRADVGSAPTPSTPYDRLVSRFGIMFYDDPPSAFARLRDWLAPGGRCAFAVWGSPEQNQWMTSVRQAAAEVVAVPQPDPDAPGPFRYADTVKLLDLLERAGLVELAVRDWRGPLLLGGGLPAAEAVDFALNAFSAGDLLAEAGDAARAQARQSLTRQFSLHEHQGAVQMDALVHIVTGARP